MDRAPHRRSANPPIGYLVGVLALAALVLASGTARTRLWDRDEPRNAGCAREMLERGDWIVPVFNGELRTHKPILLYWLMMASYRAFGISEFSARLPSLLLSIGTCLLTFSIGRRLADSATGLLAAAILATTLMFNVAAHAATPDATLIFCITASLALYLHFAWPLESPTHYPSTGRSIAIYAMMGLAVLAKGPAGFILPCAAIGLFLLSERLPHGDDQTERRSSWSWPLRRALSLFHPGRSLQTVWQMRPITLTLTVLAVAGPWYLLVGWRTDGEWLRGFFLEHNLGRATTALEGHSGSALWFYPLAILVGFFPWSVWALPASLDVAARLRDERHASATRFLLAWIAAIVGIFSVAQTKLPSYVTPVYPAIAVLVARSLQAPSHVLATHAARWRRLADGVLVLIGVALSIGLYVAARHYLPPLAGWAAIGLIPAATGLVGWWAARAVPRHWHTIQCAGAVLLAIVVFGWLAPAVSHQRRYGELISLIEGDPRIPVATLGALEPSWVYYSGRSWTELDYPRSARPSPLGAGRQPDSRPLPLDAYLAAHPDSWLVVTEQAWERIAPWHDRFQRVATVPYFLKRGELILLRSTRSTANRPSHTADQSTPPARR